MTTPPLSVSTPAASAAAPSAAAALASLTELVFDGPPPVAFELWDGSRIESATTGGPTVRLCSPVALRRLLWAPDELGLGRAYVAGDADLDGDVIETLRALRIPQPTGRKRAQLVGRAARVAAVALDAIGPPPPPPPEEVRLRGRRHTQRRDSHAVSHHYDVGNDVLPHDARSDDDVLLRAVGRRRDRHRRGADREARSRLPQARPRRSARHPPARRRLRVGHDGNARGCGVRRPRRSASRSASSSSREPPTG